MCAYATSHALPRDAALSCAPVGCSCRVLVHDRTAARTHWPRATRTAMQTCHCNRAPSCCAPPPPGAARPHGSIGDDQRSEPHAPARTGRPAAPNHTRAPHRRDGALGGHRGASSLPDGGGPPRAAASGRARQQLRSVTAAARDPPSSRDCQRWAATLRLTVPRGSFARMGSCHRGARPAVPFSCQTQPPAQQQLVTGGVRDGVARGKGGRELLLRRLARAPHPHRSDLTRAQHMTCAVDALAAVAAVGP